MKRSVDTASVRIIVPNHASVTAPAAQWVGMKVESARLARVRPSAGRIHAAAVHPAPGRATAAAPTTTVATASTADARSRTRRKLDIGAACVTSYIGSIHGPYAAATPATGTSGATTRKKSVPPGVPELAAQAEKPTATAAAPNQESRSEGVAARSLAT